MPIPFGTSLTPLPAPTPPDRREYVDPNNQIQSSRLIDIATKDYVLSSNGHFVGQDVVKQQVYLSLITSFNSSAQSGLGNQFFNIRLITPNITNQATGYVKQALASLISNGSIALNEVQVILNGPGQVILVVNWTELATGTKQTTNVKANQ